MRVAAGDGPDGNSHPQQARQQAIGPPDFVPEVLFPALEFPLDAAADPEDVAAGVGVGQGVVDGVAVAVVGL